MNEKEHQMNKPNVYHSSDYAGLSFNGGSFYYGYEKSMCMKCRNMNDGEYCTKCEDADREWCFSAQFDGKDIVIPFNRLGTEDMFDVTENLLTGIGWVLARYELKLKDQSCE